MAKPKALDTVILGDYKYLSDMSGLYEMSFMYNNLYRINVQIYTYHR